MLLTKVLLIGQDFYFDRLGQIVAANQYILSDSQQFLDNEFLASNGVKTSPDVKNSFIE